jgi:hypothetical protein
MAYQSDNSCVYFILYGTHIWDTLGYPNIISGMIPKCPKNPKILGGHPMRQPLLVNLAAIGSLLYEPPLKKYRKVFSGCKRGSNRIHHTFQLFYRGCHTIWSFHIQVAMENCPFSSMMSDDLLVKIGDVPYQIVKWHERVTINFPFDDGVCHPFIVVYIVGFATLTWIVMFVTHYIPS